MTPDEPGRADGPEIVFAPWTQEQVDALNAWQRSGQFHGFTCLYHSRRSLLARHYGWRCPEPGCAYTQNWAHAFMAGPLLPVNRPSS